MGLYYCPSILSKWDYHLILDCIVKEVGPPLSRHASIMHYDVNCLKMYALAFMTRGNIPFENSLWQVYHQLRKIRLSY